MSSTLEINGKKLLTIKSAAQLTGYSRDYITRLAREKKISAAQVGRQWFVEENSLQHYAEFASHEQKIRQQHLSDERKSERLLKEGFEAKLLARQKTARQLKSRARKGVVTTLALGLLLGLGLETVSTVPVPLGEQVASAPIVKQFYSATLNHGVSTKVETNQDQNIFDESTPVQTPHFSEDSVHIATIKDGEEGVLLLPQNNQKEISPAELFSDDVIVTTDTSGNQYISRIDIHTGETTLIPFVIVPVNSPQNTP